jgi:hypothetical protein
VSFLSKLAYGQIDLTQEVGWSAGTNAKNVKSVRPFSKKGNTFKWMIEYI